MRKLNGYLLSIAAASCLYTTTAPALEVGKCAAYIQVPGAVGKDRIQTIHFGWRLENDVLSTEFAGQQDTSGGLTKTIDTKSKRRPITFLEGDQAKYIISHGELLFMSGIYIKKAKDSKSSGHLMSWSLSKAIDVSGEADRWVLITEKVDGAKVLDYTVRCHSFNSEIIIEPEELNASDDLRLTSEEKT